MAARTVQRHDQFRAVEHSMLKILVERDGIVRAGIHTELAEHARTEVVFVLNQYLLFLAVFRFNHLAGHLDSVVGTSHLAQTASYTPMFIFIIMGHGQRATETVGEFQCRAVFRILFGSLSSAEYGHGCLHTCQQRSDAVYESADIRVLFFHYFCLY